MTRIGMFAALAGAAVVSACGGENARPEPGLRVAEETAPASSDSLTMPGIPEPRRRYLTAVSDGPYLLDGSWEAVAGMCQDPPMLEVVGQQPGIGTLVLLQLPPAGQRVTRYPIRIVERGAPEPPAAQVGVQVFRDRAIAFQATDGEVEIYGFDTRVSGRFRVTLREIGSGDSAKYAGVFHEVAVGPLPEEQCEAAKAALAADSADSTTIP